MKKKSLLLTAVATLGLTAATMAQNVPSYVPTNGLVGWWPFNGNANDESGNGYNCYVMNGTSLANDRFQSPNSAYYFDGINDFIFTSGFPFLNQSFTFNSWIRTYSLSPQLQSFGNHGMTTSCCPETWNFGFEGPLSRLNLYDNTNQTFLPSINGQSFLNQWKMITISYSNNTQKAYVDGVFLGQRSINTPIATNGSDSLKFGTRIIGDQQFFGNIDDIGIWNRALTQQEITALYSAVNCANNTTITPPTNTLQTGNTASFTASTSDSNPSFVWQSNLGQGFQTLNTIENYSGTQTATLSIANVQLSNHNQPIRVITTSGNCIDTSNIAIITIADTCINSVTDTNLVTVTDTLLINTSITGLNPPGNTNTIKIFPNPTNDHITIHYGYFPVMTGYQLRIENSLGQQVFQTNIVQQSDYLSLANWGGNGLYFVHIIDPLGNTIDIRKIVMQ